MGQKAVENSFCGYFFALLISNLTFAVDVKFRRSYEGFQRLLYKACCYVWRIAPVQTHPGKAFQQFSRLL